jgi:hypothetical protein
MRNQPELHKLFNEILKVETEIKSQTIDQILAAKQLFIKLVTTWEETWDNQNELYDKFGIDLNLYDMPLYSIIENLIRLIFGIEKSAVIFWYIYSRKNEDGTINKLINKSGDEFIIKNAVDLFELLNSSDNLEFDINNDAI